MAAAARQKRKRNFVRVAVIIAIAVGLYFLITFCSGRGEGEATVDVAETVEEELPGPTPSLSDSQDEQDELEDSEGSEDSQEGSASVPATDERVSDERTSDEETTEADVEAPEEDDMFRSRNQPNYRPYRTEDYGGGQCAPEEGVEEPVLEFANAPPLCIDTSKSYTAVFETTLGTVIVALDAINTPGTVNNFVNLARFGYYEGTLIHRSAPSIGILQGGSPHTNSAADPGPGYKIWDEGSDFKYRPGQIVMARTGERNSAGAQYFFTVTEDAGLLDNSGEYVVFGEVTQGLEVLEAMLDSHEEYPPEHPLAGSGLGGSPSPPVSVSVRIESA